jgi:hypothetical protein
MDIIAEFIFLLSSYFFFFLGGGAIIDERVRHFVFSLPVVVVVVWLLLVDPIERIDPAVAKTTGQWITPPAYRSAL